MKESEPGQGQPGPQLGRLRAHCDSSLRLNSRVAVGVGRAVASIEPDLMRPVAHGPLDEEFRIEGDATLGLHVKLHHPAVDAIWRELRIDRAVERDGEIEPSAIEADLDHMRSADDS